MRITDPVADKKALKDSALQLYQAWLSNERPTIPSPRESRLIEAAFIAGLHMALDAQVHYLMDLPIIATNIVKDGCVLFVTAREVSKLIFTGE